MADPTTANTSMTVPLRGADVGTWDTPVNGNFNALDAMLGGIQVYALTNTNVTMQTSGAQNSVIRLTGTLSASISITLTGIYKFWVVDNQLTNSPSSFSVTIISTSGGSIIGAPPGMQNIYYDGTNVRYIGPDRIGSYWDYAGAAIPNWITNCTVLPYLNCDGTTFSSATYPILTNLLGTTTLPDSRGRYRATLNQTSSRITSSAGGVDGNTAYASGGAATITLNTSNLPPYTPSGLVTNQTVEFYNVSGGTSLNPSIFGVGLARAPTSSMTFAGNAQGGVSNPFSTISPTYIGGYTFIRAI